MAFTQQQREEIIAAIKKAAPQLSSCSICGQGNWSLADGFVAPALQDNLKAITLGGLVLPSVAISCLNCGNTHLLNAIVLGLAHLLEGSTQSAPIVEQPAPEQKAR